MDSQKEKILRETLEKYSGQGHILALHLDLIYGRAEPPYITKENDIYLLHTSNILIDEGYLRTIYKGMLLKFYGWRDVEGGEKLNSGAEVDHKGKCIEIPSSIFEHLVTATNTNELENSVIENKALFHKKHCLPTYIVLFEGAIKEFFYGKKDYFRRLCVLQETSCIKEQGNLLLQILTKNTVFGC